MRAITDEEREAIALLLEKIPPLIADELKAYHTMQDVYAPWTRLLYELSGAAVSFAGTHGSVNDKEFNEIYEAGWVVQNLLRGG